MLLHPSFRIFQYGPPARPEDVQRVTERYPALPAGYRSAVEEATAVTLLWNGRGELRLWGPEEVLAMDAAYGVSAMIPGAMPFGDNGGGEILVYGDGLRGPGLYLLEAGSLFLDEDAEWLATDVDTLLTSAEGAAKIFKSDPIDPADLGPPIYRDGEFR
ncbi:hypothetical protein [Sphingomonas endolithica]|uniref:hypothetical protein n=1 Tax=Sphingomonas endolithica TaxID=2972485 RepID=UPI0021AEA9AD|nr:hypothetical protein [Sphingomonas sp. ZFBP2030]